MYDKSENCPVCLKKMKEHTVLDMVNCSEKLIKENKDDSNQTSFDKNQEALKLINGLLELSQKDLEEYLIANLFKLGSLSHSVSIKRLFLSKSVITLKAS